MSAVLLVLIVVVVPGLLRFISTCWPTKRQSTSCGKQIIDPGTKPWAINVVKVETKDVDLPDPMKHAMPRQAEAERERRSKVIAAEGEFQAAARLLPGGGRDQRRAPWRGRRVSEQQLGGRVPGRDDGPSSEPEALVTRRGQRVAQLAKEAADAAGHRAAAAGRRQELAHARVAELHDQLPIHRPHDAALRLAEASRAAEAAYRAAIEGYGRAAVAHAHVAGAHERAAASAERHGDLKQAAEHRRHAAKARAKAREARQGAQAHATSGEELGRDDTAPRRVSKQLHERPPAAWLLRPR